MARNLVPLLAFLAVCSPGCCYTAGITGEYDLFANSFRNLTEGPITLGDNKVETHRIRSLADKAWHALVKNDPAMHHCKDYACGFKDGYADYLDFGGKCNQPPMPPFCYQKYCYHTPEGQMAVRDWHAGFLHGTAAARESGIRETLLVPVFALPANPHQRPMDDPGDGSLAGQQTSEQPAPGRPQPTPDLPAPSAVTPRPQGTPMEDPMDSPSDLDILPRPKTLPMNPPLDKVPMRPQNPR